MTDLPCPSIMCPAGLEEVLGSASEGRPLPFSRRTGSPAQAGGAGRLARDEADRRSSYLWSGWRQGSSVDGPIPPGRRSSAGPKAPGSPTGAQAQREQQTAIVALIEGHCPDQLGLPAF